MSSSPNIVLKTQTMSHVNDTNCSEFEDDDIERDKEELPRIKSTNSLGNFDVTESNILSSLFDGIPINIGTSPSIYSIQDKHELYRYQPKMKCVNVIQRAKQRSNAIVMATGHREPDEIRIIFKQRPLGIQIKAVNVHGFGAKISKITNNSVYQQGVRENMIITGLNNKDLLGCTFDQIMSIIKAADLPITLRFKKISNIMPQMNVLQISNTTTYSSSSHSLTSPSTRNRRIAIGPQREGNMLQSIYDVNSLEPPSLTPKDNLMLASFSVENMPVSTVLSSSSDEDDIDNGPIVQNIDEDQIIDLVQDQEDEDGMSYVQWNNIRLGASVIKHGWALDIDNDEDETTFELAYDTLTRQGLNIYEIRAAIRLIREQPEQIPPLEAFDHLTINKRGIKSCINPKFMPQQWLKEKNFHIDDVLSSTDDDADADDEEEYDEAQNTDDDNEDEDEDSEYSTTDSSLSSGPSTSSLQNALQRMKNMNSNNIYFDTFINKQMDSELSATPNKLKSIPTPIPHIINDENNDENNCNDTEQYDTSASSFRKNDKLYISKSYNECSTSLYLQRRNASHASCHSEHDYEFKFSKKPISGYIDFFDDNESSTSSSSISQSIELQQAMDVIGLKSPDFDNIAALYSTFDDYDDMDNDNKDIGLVQNADGELVVMDRRGHIIDTPDYVDDHEVEYAEYSSDGIDGIGISSYICTEGADDLLENECLPQDMLKYVVPEEQEEEEEEEDKEKEKSGFNFLLHLKNMAKNDEGNNKLLGLKNSIRGLSIKTNMKSIFKKISPGTTPSNNNNNNSKSQ